MTVRMKDVADHLGVSVTSVSHAFNRPDRVSAQLRRQILEGAAELGYHGPSAAGRALRSGRAGAIGVVFDERLSYVFTDPYALQLLAGFTQVLEEAGIGVFLIPTADDVLGTSGTVDMAVVDGVVGVCAGTRDPGITAAARRGLPIVLTTVSADHDFVAIDDRAAGLLVAEHLEDLRHSEVVVLFDSPQDEGRVRTLTVAELDLEVAALYRRGWDEGAARIDGLRAGAADRGPAAVVAVTAGRNTRVNGRRCAAALLSLDRPPTAVAAVSDVLALGVLDELAARGLVAGPDVSVTGVDGLPEAVAAGVTTVVQPAHEKGRLAARLLLDPEVRERQVLLPVELRLGTSTAPAG